ncbi:hypothetical protein BAY59_22090 [Prauserella coralliicola]|nr:hypothetical protein BAY59_22090 [Prauserella coralliicola]
MSFDQFLGGEPTPARYRAQLGDLFERDAVHLSRRKIEYASEQIDSRLTDYPASLTRSPRQ